MSMNVTPDDHGPSILVTATRVPEHQRLDFLPRFFGRDMLLGEALVYRSLAKLSPDYDGGYWEFYDLSNGGHYMAPALSCETLRLRCPGNFYDGTMSPDAAGIVATLYALNRLVWKTRRFELQDSFDLLRNYASDHVEGPAIFAAID